MAHTLTQEEFLYLKQVALDMCLFKIKDYVSKSLLGYKVNRQYLKNLMQMVIVKKALDTWEQTKFHNIEYSNYFTDADVRNLITKIKELTYVR